MVGHLPPIEVLMGIVLLFGSAKATFNWDLYGTLTGLVLRHLNGSISDFDWWTLRMSHALEPEQQQRLAWNMPWTQALRQGRSLLELQEQLRPSNPLKLQLWMGFYWHLRRSSRLDGRLTFDFARTLRRLQLQQQPQPELWSPQLQNMWQSLPRSMRLILHSRWLCLQHEREMLYAVGGLRLELGANSNCSMWQVQELSEQRGHWLGLFNVCDKNSRWFISMQEHDAATHLLHSVPSHTARKLCVLEGLGYLGDAVSPLSDCHWKLNDCSHLPQILFGS
ncbi:uncharacterized protein [Drosophila pseudoobscura]|uniref:Uncharacterized protein n=1 Tax=Drosophila pseudoobscura pseudoobscura TaxID=46245 RepID=A0A6I8V4Z9_DROPS|nr:uncharacterized protein LOC6899106 [Drosophila pseudoobscura]